MLIIKKIQWKNTIIAILTGTCIGLVALLAQEKYDASQLSFASSVKKAAPSVVNIYTQTKKPEGIQKNTLHTTNLGSGVITTKNGYLLTNYHVIQNSEHIIVGLNDGRQTDASIIGSDPFSDLAVLKINLPKLTPITLGNSDNIQIGDKILAIGNPYGIGQTVTAGIISAKGRNSIGSNAYENFLQTDAAINPGNSGGALINLKGELVGISSAIYSSTGGFQGIGFAIPVNDAIKIMSELIKSGKVTRSYLGIDSKKVTRQLAQNLHLSVDHGLLVSRIMAKSPADKAGIEVGDIILKINKQPSINPQKTNQLIAAMAPGTSVPLIGIRGKQSYQANIILETQPIMQQNTQ